jgi:hypothetical protein
LDLQAAAPSTFFSLPRRVCADIQRLSIGSRRATNYFYPYNSISGGEDSCLQEKRYKEQSLRDVHFQDSACHYSFTRLTRMINQKPFLPIKALHYNQGS